MLTKAYFYEKVGPSKSCIYYLTAAESSSSVIPTREVTTSCDLKHWPVRMPASEIFNYNQYFQSARMPARKYTPLDQKQHFESRNKSMETTSSVPGEVVITTF